MRPEAIDETRPSRLPSLTGVRLLGAIAVIAIHTASSWFSSAAILDATGLGYLGVTLFFILSGYVLAWSRRASTGVRGFYAARVARIWPLHLATLAIAWAFLPMPVSVIAPVHAMGIAANVLLLQAWSPHAAVYFGLNGVAWSLSCEIFFYLLFPWLDRGVARLSRAGQRRLLVVIALWLVVPVAVAHAASHTWGQPERFWFWLTFICPVYNLAFFLLGVLLPRLVDARRTTRAATRATAVLGVFAAAIVAVLYAKTPGTPSRDFVTLIVLPFLALSVVAAAGSDVRDAGFSLLRWRPVVIGGECAFAIYLTHQLIWKQIYLWGDHVPHTGFTPHELLPLYLLAVAVVGVGTHYLIVRKAESALLRWWRRPPAPPAIQPGLMDPTVAVVSSAA